MSMTIAVYHFQDHNTIINLLQEHSLTVHPLQDHSETVLQLEDHTTIHNEEDLNNVFPDPCDKIGNMPGKCTITFDTSVSIM